VKKGHLLTIGIAVVLTAAVFFAISRKKQPVVSGQANAQRELSDYKHGADIFITPAELRLKLHDPTVVILDGNNPKLYAESHIPGAINIGFKGLSRSQGKPGDAEWGTILPQRELKEKLESLGITNNSLVVCYSETFKGPGADGRAVWQMRMAGLTNVKLLYGGFALWKQSGYETTDTVPEVSRSTGVTLQEYDENFRAKMEYIAQKIDVVPLIDVRSKNEFTGEDVSRGEARGGHIKNAKWLEWTALLNKDGTPKSPPEIVALMASVGVRPDDEVVVY
jgi:thiosulfate/3-mercaptopyruvate sulfurtransferase